MTRTSLLLLLVLAGPAWASDTYPAVIKNKYTLASEPPESCGLCHTNFITGLGTVNTPFGRSARMRGLVASDTAVLDDVLNTLAADGTDSDGDGVSDVAELVAGTSPNQGTVMDGGTGGGGGGGGTVLPSPRYGCGSSVVPELLFFAGLLPLLRSRRRRPC